MNWFRWRKMRKAAKHRLHEAKHARAMREDVAPAADLAALDRAAAALRAAVRARDPGACEAAMAGLSDAVHAVYPPRNAPVLREYVEIFAVAIAVAMGVRTYFVQPFKIPTGSMQPTLFGVVVEPQRGRAWMDWPPVSLLRWALFGEGYVEVKAKKTGTIDRFARPAEDGYFLLVEGTPHYIRRSMPRLREPGDFVTRGEVLACGRVRLGDHVFVNKLRYNFGRPSRGHIVVFDTAGIEYPGIKKGFYIKRLAGMPGETIAIDPPRLVADGRPVGEPYPFRRLVEATDRGYHGYEFAMPHAQPRPKLAAAADRLALGPEEFLPLGDNTRSSLDGRYFGGVRRSNLVGPAFAVYWPLSRRWGPVR